VPSQGHGFWLGTHTRNAVSPCSYVIKSFLRRIVLRSPINVAILGVVRDFLQLFSASVVMEF